MSIYRITQSARPELAGDEVPGAPGGSKEDVESYVEKAVKLIPADVVAAYLALRNIWLPQDADGDPLGKLFLSWILPVAGFLSVIGLRILGTTKSFASLKASEIQWPVVVVSAIAYVAWILSFHDPLFGYEPLDPRLTGTLLILISIAAPSIVRPDKE